MHLTSLPAVPPFARSDAFSLGVEEELLLAHPATLRPLGGTDALLARARPPAERVTGHVCDGVLELRTPVCRRAGEAVDVLAGLRGELAAFIPLIGAGVHPLGRFGDVRLRAAATGDGMGAPPHQTPLCGLRVHVGMPDAETAVRAGNGMRDWIPLLQALAANSPYWYGRDSGLASARAVIRGALPRAGIPRTFADYEDFAATVSELQALGESHSSVGWDVRPRPELGTLEVGAFDAQSSLEDLTALVALTHCLVRHEATKPRAFRGPGPEALRELSFRATRDGLDAQLAFDGALRPVREVAYHAVALAGAYAADLGCWEELMLVHRLLEVGNGAVRQRRGAEQGGVRLMLRRLADETMLRRPVSPVTADPEPLAATGSAAA
jgi:carboxylate-amine ligase